MPWRYGLQTSTCSAAQPHDITGQRCELYWSQQLQQHSVLMSVNRTAYYACSWPQPGAGQSQAPSVWPATCTALANHIQHHHQVTSPRPSSLMVPTTSMGTKGDSWLPTTGTPSAYNSTMLLQLVMRRCCSAVSVSWAAPSSDLPCACQACCIAVGL